MPKSGLVFSKLATWIGAPLGCALIGYFVVAPRFVKQSPSREAKPQEEILAPVDTSTDPPVESNQKPATKLKKPAVKSEDDPPETETPDKSAADDRPVLEVTTTSADHTPKPVKKKAKKRKPAPATPAADPASNGDPGVPSKSSAPNTDEPSVTPP